MKKIVTSLFLLSFVSLGFGQVVLLDDEHNVVTNTTIDIVLAPGASSTKEILIKNSGSVKDTLKALRTIYSVDANDQTQFCFGGLCYAHATNLSSLTLSVNAGDTVDYAENGFHALFTAGSACVTRTVHYRFYNVNNFSDSAGVSIRYTCTTGIDDVNEVSGTLSNAYPNPANSAVTFKYAMNSASQNGKIVFYDMLGKAVKETTLTEKQGSVKINISDLNSGIYFYTYMIGDKSITSKKLIVTN